MRKAYQTLYIIAALAFLNIETNCQSDISPFPPYSHTSIVSDLEYAIKLTNSAENSKIPEKFIGQTWIFGWWGKQPVKLQQSMEDNFADTYSKYSLDNFYPMVIVSCFGDEKLKTNFSYDKEFELNDLLNPTRFGVLQLATNYFSVFISVGEGGDENSEIPGTITTALIVQKFARPHLDYFFYIGSHEVHSRFFETFQLQDIRYKFGIMLSSRQNLTFTEFLNPCRKKFDKSLPLFSRKCDKIISDRHYHITACKVESMVRYQNYPDGSMKWGAGTVLAMFVEASRRHNFTFDIRYAHYDGASGFKENGVWKGAVGEVLSRESDIAFAVGVTVSRLPIIDPSVAQTRISRVFYIKTPPRFTNWKSIIWPLSWEIWLLTFVMAMCLVVPVYYLSSVFYYKTVKGQFDPPDYLVLEIFDTLFRILMEQSATAKQMHKQRRGTNRIRVIIVLWALFSLVLGTGYRSKLFSFLSFLEPDRVPETHKELSLSNYKIYFRYMGGIAYLYYLNSKDPIHQRTLKKATLVNSSQECVLKALLEENAACLEYQVNGDFTIQSNMTLNPLRKASEVFVTSKDKELSNIINWSFRKGSPWRESFDKVILFSLAAGLYEVWQSQEAYTSRVASSHWLNSQSQSPVRRKIEEVLAGVTTGPKPLNIRSLIAVFVILGIGFLIAGFIWIGEKLQFYFKRVRIEKQVAVELVVKKQLSQNPHGRPIHQLKRDSIGRPIDI